MRENEYEILRRVEDTHWWHAGLRENIKHFWGKYVPPSAERLLDVGCGTGANLALLAPSIKTYGLDFSPRALAFCRGRGLERTLAASVTQIPCASNSFDVLISCDVLCHESIQDRQAALVEMRRVLKPGGALLINLPAYQWLFSSHDRATQTGRRFTRTELKAWLEAASFTPLHLTYWNSLLFVPMAAVRLWRKVRPSPNSDLDDEPGRIAGSILGGILDAERAILRRVPLPFGLSVFAVARKS